MHRVIGRLTAGVQQLDVSVDVACARLDSAQQRLRAQVVRARTGHQQAVVVQHAQRQLIEFAIGRFALRQFFSALDERRRVDDHGIVAFAGGSQFRQHVERITAMQDRRASEGRTVQGRTLEGRRTFIGRGYGFHRIGWIKRYSNPFPNELQLQQILIDLRFNIRNVDVIR